jgi:hypothetical protein
MVHLGQLQENSSDAQPGDDTRRAVLSAYTTAARRPAETGYRAFEMALRAYRDRHPAVSEAFARRQVATIICYVEWYRPI